MRGPSKRPLGTLRVLLKLRVTLRARHRLLRLRRLRELYGAAAAALVLAGGTAVPDWRRRRHQDFHHVRRRRRAAHGLGCRVYLLLPLLPEVHYSRAAAYPARTVTRSPST